MTLRTASRQELAGLRTWHKKLQKVTRTLKTRSRLLSPSSAWESRPWGKQEPKSRSNS